MTRSTILQRRRRLRRPTDARRGSALLVVIVLMTMLASLGVIFYVFAAQERTASINYSDAAKVQTYDISVDTLMDFGLEQLVVGPDTRYKNSALYGKRHALLPNMLGLDTTGTKLDFTPFNGQPLDSTTAANWSINDSPAANGGTERQATLLANRDPDYTYPDLNNVFLSYHGFDPVFGRRIIIPSFHRPQSPQIKGVATWYSSGTAVNHVLRPHQSHQYVWPPGQQQGSGAAVSRYLTAAEVTSLGASWSGWGTFPITPRDLDSDGTSGEQGVWSATGSLTASVPANANNYEYDVDNDGDGINEGVWLDLDFPVLETPDGKNYVPFFSFTVIDQDALLNLNVHGNLARVWQGDVPMQAPFGYSAADPFVSKSNLGLSPAEINPLWGMNRRPRRSGAMSPYPDDGDYGTDPFFDPSTSTLPINWRESANRDWLYLLMGRYTPSPSDLVPGRFGEEHLLYRAITNSSTLTPYAFAFNSSGVLTNPWPGPGQTQLDDNGDQQQSVGAWFGGSYAPFGHPLDFSGLGSYLSSAKVANYGTNGQARWPQYNRYSSETANPVGWPQLTNTLQNTLLNDMAEQIFDPALRRPEDNQFGPDEMRALQMSFTDLVAATGGQTRLTQLAPFTFDATAGNYDNRTKQFFRSKFTTASWDRKQFTLAQNSTLRPWEFTADADNDGKLEFPPRFGTTQPYSSTTPGADPFRPLLRRMMEIELNNFDRPQYALRLNLNQLLTGPAGNPAPTFVTNQYPPNLQLNYRPLTPHPVQSSLGATAVSTPSPATYPAGGNFTSLAQQEFWARRDRQLMCRDLYVLLYTMTFPHVDSSNAAMNPTAAAFASTTQNQAAIRQLAQYAVNIVDSLDRDNVVTRFEYDLNLANGWDLDDISTTVDGSGDRYEVYGVERLDLTLSEALAVRADQTTSNLPFTQWDDTSDRHFSYVELRNPGPNSVTLTNQSWMIEFGPDYTDQTNVSAADLVNVRRLTLKAGSITSGQLFTIGSADASAGGTYPSILKVDPSGSTPADWDADANLRIAPKQQTLDLDLKDSSQTTQYSLTDATGTVVPTGALYDNGVYTKVTGTGGPLYVRLYRRQSPDRPVPSNNSEELDNPYILVDEIALNDVGTSTNSSRGGRLQLVSADTNITGKLANLQSRRRTQPFSGVDDNGYAYTTASGAYANTLADNNDSTIFRNWQKVLDRDFASRGELLGVTLGGFSNAERLRTQGLATGNNLGRAALPGIGTRINADASVTNAWYLQTQTTSAAVATVDTSAEQLFMPQGITADARPPQWHRFLELVEVPSRLMANVPGTPNPLDYPRTPGKINPNMMRHPEALAALLDDPSVMSLYVDEDANLNGSLDSGEDLDSSMDISVFTVPLLSRTDQTPPSGVVSSYTDYAQRTIGGSSIKTWWDGLIASRDGNPNGGLNGTPFSGNGLSTDVTQLFLPGVPGSRPFRSFSLPNRGNGNEYLNVQDTLLRPWPGDAANLNSGTSHNPRGLFEVGTQEDHRGQDATSPTPIQVQQLEQPVRQRLLTKVLNNTTPRSNVFVVFMSVKYFRANIESNGAVRIGGPLKDPSDTDRWSPEHRGFFVIDRSQVEHAYDAATGKYDFRPLLQFRQVLQ